MSDPTSDITDVSDILKQKFADKDTTKGPVATDANFNESTVNRGTETAVVSGDAPFISVTLEIIDESIINYLNNKISPTISVGTTSVKVPTIYGNSERWNNVRKEGVYRDTKGKIQTPLIMVRRTSVARNQTLVNPLNKYHRYIYKAQWNEKKAYSKFNAQNGIAPSNKYIEVMAPDYVEVNYECIIWTELQSHMGSVIEQLNFEMDEYWGELGGFKFKVKTDDFQLQTELPADSARTVRSTFNLLVRGYLLPKHSLGRSVGKNIYSNKKTVTFIEVDNTGK